MASIIREGKAEIFLENFENFKGPGKRMPGFYNPTFSMDRDIQIVFCQHIVNRGARRILDAMAATGIRGIRMALEVEGEKEVDINDCNVLSFQIIKKNVEMNGAIVNIFNRKICSLMEERRYDYIDLDPYGSPAPFIPFIFSGMKKKTYVSISATDTATLCGAYRKTCMRRYGAIPVRRDGVREAGLRILLGFIARAAAVHDYAFVPLISYAHSHYFRVYGLMERGARKADDSMRNVGWIYWEDGWKISPFEEMVKDASGPMWIGGLHDITFIKEMRKGMDSMNLEHEHEIRKLLHHFEEEAEMPPLYYETGRIASETKGKQPKMDALIENLRGMGYKAGRCHFTPNAIKSDAPYSEIMKLF
ncbi:MAG: tRNA (guanine(10)-N(2))-dimethyltransferase [Thermoplasmata archaeon]|nr:tRNA (guanine(10)-N(2))-dimethyltransferase [Thermoplasmata archaeon]